MHGKPADGTDSAINVKPTNQSFRMKQKAKNKQKKLKRQKNKNLKKIRNKNNKRKNHKKPSNRRGRQNDCTGIDTCVATGDYIKNENYDIALAIYFFLVVTLG